METLLLTRSYLARRLSPERSLAAVEAAFRALANGELETPAVGHLPADGGGFHLKAAARRSGGQRAVIKLNGNFPGNPARYGLPTIQGFVALLDARCGRLLALMDSGEITARRTAAASALAARLLARERSTRLALIGCGLQARHHFEALSGLFPFERVALCDLDARNAEALAATVRAAGPGARVADTPAEAARDADIVVTCTPSTSAILHSGDVARGAFVAAVGADHPHKQELSPDLLRRARVVPDVLAQASTMGDLHHALDAGTMTAADIHGELSQVVAGRVAGRRDDDEIFVFDSTGTAIEDLATAELAWEVASRDADAPQLSLGV
jgi:ornithine cyclodeaminase/alanine dehydrogenase-like protein (mu-crystallin family)